MTKLDIPLMDWVLSEAIEGCEGVISGSGEPNTRQINGEAIYGASGEVSCDQKGCWTTLPRFAKSWHQAPDPQHIFDSGKLWTGMIEARRHNVTGQLEATVSATHLETSGVRKMTRHWDVEGRLIFERIQHNARLKSESRYTWEGDQLVRVEVNDPHGEGGRSVRDIFYDDEERLIKASIHHIDQETSGLTEWDYDDAGRPHEMTRSLISPDGLKIQAERFAWSFSETGFTNEDLRERSNRWISLSSPIRENRQLQST